MTYPEIYEIVANRRAFIRSFLTCRQKKYNKYFSKEAFENYMTLIFEDNILRIIIYVHLSFIVILPIYMIYSYVYKSPWNIVIQKAKDPIALASIGLSFQLAFITAVLNTIFGYIITWCIIRYEFRGRRFLDAAVDFPISMPTTVAGIVLISLYGEKGFFGYILRFLGNRKIIYTRNGALLAMVFASAPFVVRSVYPVLEKITKDLEMEEDAWCLSTSDKDIFLKILFPLTFPALLNGFSLSFSRALGEFGSVVMVSGNFPFEDLVSSVYINQALEQFDYIGACTISSIVIFGACIFLTIIYSLRYFFVTRKK